MIIQKFWSDGKLYVNDKEAQVIKNIYSWYLDGKSMGDIVKILNDTKVPTKNQGFWAKKMISTILKNPVYCGYLHWEKYVNKSDHESIITIQTFNSVQQAANCKKAGKPWPYKKWQVWIENGNRSPSRHRQQEKSNKSFPQTMYQTFHKFSPIFDCWASEIFLSITHLFSS